MLVGESDYGQAYMCMYGKTAVFGDESTSCMCGWAADSVALIDRCRHRMQ